MIPTLAGRLQTRLFLAVAVGAPLTVVLALLWGLLQAELVPLVTGPVRGDVFTIMFVVVWLGQWLFANGPIRVLSIRWRLRGGRLM